MNYYHEIKTRVLWLLIGLGLSLIIAKIITGFEETLSTNLVLASFIPLILNMSDSVGTQMESMIIRELHKKGRFDFGGFLKRQVVIVSAVAVIIGSIACAAIWIVNSNPRLGIVVGLSLIGGTMGSLVTGSVLPYFFWRMHSDPAEASGPIATVVQDFISILIFLLIAQALI